MGYGSEPLSKELTPKDREMLDKMFEGLRQAVTGPTRHAVVQKILEQFDSAHVEKIEASLKDLHGMSKFEKFRTNAIFLLAAVYQNGINFALNTEGVSLADKIRLGNLIKNIVESAAKEGAGDALKAMGKVPKRK